MKTKISALLLCLLLVMSMATAVYADASIVLETVIIDKDTPIADLISNSILTGNAVKSENVQDDGSLFIPGGASETRAHILKNKLMKEYATYKVSAEFKSPSAGIPTKVSLASASNMNLTVKDSEDSANYKYYSTNFETSDDWGNKKTGTSDYFSEFVFYGAASKAADRSAGYDKLFFRESRSGYEDTAYKGYYIRNIEVIEYVTVDLLKLAIGSASIAKGEETGLTASTFKPGEHSSPKYTVTTHDMISYESSNPSVAKVSEDGIVTGVSAGTAVITAKLGTESEYLSADVTVTVTSTEPSVNASSDVITRKNAKVLGKVWDYTAYLYSTVDFGSGYETGDYGFEVAFEDDADVMVLPVVIDENDDSVPEAFAIRIVGNGIEGSYTAVPYVTANGEKISGNQVTFTFDENTQVSE